MGQFTLVSVTFSYGFGISVETVTAPSVENHVRQIVDFTHVLISVLYKMKFGILFEIQFRALEKVDRRKE